MLQKPNIIDKCKLSLSPPPQKSNINMPAPPIEPNSLKISCPICNTLSFSSINILKNQENKKYYINISCKNNHQEYQTLSHFNFNHQKNDIKECPNTACHKISELSKIYYCFKCKNFYCPKCCCIHYRSKPDISRYFGLLENRCKIHEFKIQEYFCNLCDKYFCKKCKVTHPENHKNLIFLGQKFEKIEKILRDEINKEKNIVMEYNKMLNLARKNISEIIEYKKNMIKIKKYILESYLNRNKNYYNIQNLNLIKTLHNNHQKIYEKKIKKLYDMCKNKKLNNSDENVNTNIKAQENIHKINNNNNNNDKLNRSYSEIRNDNFSLKNA